MQFIRKCIQKRKKYQAIKILIFTRFPDFQCKNLFVKKKTYTRLFSCSCTAY